MKRILLSLTGTLLSFTIFAQTRIDVEAPRTVEFGKTFNIVFVIEGEESPINFQWNAPEGFDTVWGPSKGNSTNVSIVNGQTTKSAKTTITYVLAPIQTGTFSMGEASARVNGRTIYSEDIIVEVVAEGAMIEEEAIAEEVETVEMPRLYDVQNTFFNMAFGGIYSEQTIKNNVGRRGSYESISDRGSFKEVVFRSVDFAGQTWDNAAFRINGSGLFYMFQVFSTYDYNEEQKATDRFFSLLDRLEKKYTITQSTDDYALFEGANGVSLVLFLTESQRYSDRYFVSLQYYHRDLYKGVLAAQDDEL